MKNKSLNRNLGAAKATKQDEFYTQLSDIEKELRHYTKHFENKCVLCNCDDPKVSNFFHYFSHNFEKLKLKKLITTCYKNCEADLFSKNTAKNGIYLVYNGAKKGSRVPTADQIGIHDLKGDGDFRSEECVNLLKQADIVVTNPPFSLFRDYVEQLVKNKKKFIIIGNKNAITYKETFMHIKENRMWAGETAMGTDMLFQVSDDLAKILIATKKKGSAYRLVDGEVMARSQSCWFTNLEHHKRNEGLVLYKTYTPREYQTYINYDAIEVSNTKDIPADYDGAMGVPLSFLDKYNPSQFEILGSSRTLSRPMSEVAEKGTFQQGGPRFYLSDSGGTYRRMYERLVIRRKT